MVICNSDGITVIKPRMEGELQEKIVRELDHLSSGFYLESCKECQYD